MHADCRFKHTHAFRWNKGGRKEKFTCKSATFVPLYKRNEAPPVLAPADQAIQESLSEYQQSIVKSNEMFIGDWCFAR